MKKEVNSAVPVENRRLAAIMFTDIVGFSRQMGTDEARTLRLLAVHNQIIQQAATAHRGTVIKTVGDAFLVDFPSVVHAVQCAQSVQTHLQAYNAEHESTEQIHVRIGIHLGDVVQQDGDVFGDGVNIASRLQALAAPDTICISDMVYRDVAQKVPLGTVVSLGRPHLKNIAQRFPVYALLSEAPKGIRQALRIQHLKLSRWVGTSGLTWVIAGLMFIAGTIVTVRFLSPKLSPQSSSVSTQEAPALPLPDKPSLVVLPFANMSNDPEQEYFSDGITEDITTGLAKISSLFVIARNSAFTYKGKAVKVQDVSREMGVQYVLEGSVRRTDKQIRITAQLIDGFTGSHLWAERFDRPLKDIFAVQDEIVQKIVTTLKLQLTLMEQGRLVRKRTDNLEAYDSCLHGVESYWLAWSEMKKEANAQARQAFEKAIELDPQYAEAYAYLGATYFLEWFYFWNRTPQTLTRAEEVAQQAVMLDESLPISHTILGSVYLWEKQYDKAVTEGKRGVALDPNNAETHTNLGQILAFAGQPEEGIESVKKAMRLNPRYPVNYLFQLSIAYRMAGRYEEALAPGEKVVALIPNTATVHFNLAVIYSELGRMEEAQTEVVEFKRLNPNASLDGLKQLLPFKDPAVLERHLAALHEAGLK